MHQAKLKVMTVDKPGILASMTKRISNMEVNITQANIRTTSDAKAVNLFTLEVKGRSQLDEAMRALEGVKGVISVTKVKG